MIRTRRVLALLLTLVLVLSLAPAAQAAPPQEACREGGEHIWDVYEDTATCTQGGTRRYRCRKCGIWYNEPSPALGHDWREGELIGGDGLLTPQRVRYVCDRCYDVKVETVQPSGSSVLDYFRNITKNKQTSSDLEITQQPVGGSLPDGEDASLTLTVQAKGGVEPYTYEWHGVDRKVTVYVDGHPVGYAVQEHNRRAAEEANQRRAAFYEAYLSFTREHLGVEDVEGAMRGWRELQIREFGDIVMTSGDSPSYAADIEECSYYCVVRDSSGQQVRSNNAYVGDPLYIAQQPEDRELSNGKAKLICIGGGGSGKYAYSWYRKDREHPLNQFGPAAIVDEPGEYFCCIQDGVWEETSVTVTVTKPKADPKASSPPRIVTQPKSVTLIGKTNNHYGVTLKCRASQDGKGDSSLIYIWQRKAGNGWVTIRAGHSRTVKLSGTSGKISGQYRCVVRNPETGRVVISKTATVRVKLDCRNLRFSGRYLTGKIVGGVPPYKVVVIQHRPKDKQHPTIKTNITVIVGVKGVLHRKMIASQYKTYSYVVMNNGKAELKHGWAYYSIIVYDSAGQVYKSGKIRYPN